MNKYIIILFEILSIALFGCSDKNYYQRILYGDIKGSENNNFRHIVRNGEDPNIAYYLILNIKINNSLKQLCVTNENLYRYLKFIYFFKNYGEFVDFILPKLLKREIVDFPDSLYNDIKYDIICCDTLIRPMKMDFKKIMKKINKDNHALRFIYKDNFNCFCKDILQFEKVFIVTRNYYNESVNYYYYYKNTDWILNEGNDPKKNNLRNNIMREIDP